jgi:hypothetical protein
MKRRLAVSGLVVAALATGLTGALAAAPSADPGVCVTISLDVNGTAQNVDQCLPPAATAK